ncbi:MAG: hypothetical protein ABI895_28380 [Deltaproteobacteria bacterium]
MRLSERLVDREGKLILQLHRREGEHDHGPIGDPDQKPSSWRSMFAASSSMPKPGSCGLLLEGRATGT